MRPYSSLNFGTERNTVFAGMNAMTKSKYAVRYTALIGAAAALAGCAEMREPTDRQREVAACLGSALAESGRASNVSALPVDDTVVIGFTLKQGDGQGTSERIRVLAPKDDANTSIAFTSSVAEPDRDLVRRALEAKCPGLGQVNAGG
jgi:hypothetical protein